MHGLRTWHHELTVLTTEEVVQAVKKTLLVFYRDHLKCAGRHEVSETILDIVRQLLAGVQVSPC